VAIAARIRKTECVELEDFKTSRLRFPMHRGVMVLRARLAASQASNRRFSPRRTLQLQSTIAEGEEDVIIHDISHTGLLLETDAFFSERQLLDVELPEVGLAKASVVWRSGRYVGCRFVKPLSRAAISAALLRNPITRPQPSDEERAWEQLGKLCEVPEADGGLSFATRMRVIAGASILLWALILWTAGVF
jgi:PilZ domain